MTYNLAQRADNASIAMEFFVSQGWYPFQAAGIVGNLLAESNLNPDTGSGDQGSAHGIAQWRGDRAEKFLVIIHKSIADATLLEQLSFVQWELQNTHARAGRALDASTTVEEATRIIDSKYEVSDGSAINKRITYAVEQWVRYQGIDKPVEVLPPVTKPVPSVPTKLKEEQVVSFIHKFFAWLIQVFGRKT